MPGAVPDADAKIGKKIDYLAAELLEALAPQGFRRKARKLWRESGDGDLLCFEVIDLQGNKWNEGSTGTFCVNIGVQFPALLRKLDDMDGAPWLSERADVPDTALATIRGRLHDVLPPAREPWWTKEMGPHDIWFEVKGTTGLGALSEVLNKSALMYIHPWLARHASLEAVVNMRQPMSSSSVEIAACLLLGRPADAQALLLAAKDQETDPARFERIKALLDAACATKLCG